MYLNKGSVRGHSPGRPGVHNSNLPPGNTVSLFLTSIPHGRDDNKRRLAYGLEETEQSSDGNEASEVFAGSVAGENGAPCDDTEREVLRYGHAGDEPVLRVFDDEDRDVDTGREPAEL